MSIASDPATFRHVLGHYPTGVCVVTAMQSHGEPVGMAVGSFTSVSLDPPLVGFFPDRRSRTWPTIASVGRFCVNVLAEHQEPLCRIFATSGSDKFKHTSYRLSEQGMPILGGIVAWIDCELYQTYDAGDHLFVLGKVHALEVDQPNSPLLFFKGGYGQFSSLQPMSS